jgi:hypothetical protein
MVSHEFCNRKRLDALGNSGGMPPWMPSAVTR